MSVAVSDKVATHSVSPPRIALYAVAAVLAWTASVSVGAAVRVDPVTELLALTLHTMSVVVAFGAVLLVDWVGFLWLVTRRRLHETSRLESAALPLIWGGLAGLLLTGALIHPDLGNGATVAKLAAVLVLMLNGIFLIPVMRRLNSMPTDTRFSDLSMGMRVHLLICLTISQGCWWTAMVIGFIHGMSG